MNTTLKTYTIKATALSGLALAIALTISPARAQTSSTSTKPTSDKNVRIMRNEDGSYTEFRRSSDERVIERRTYGDRPGGNGDRVLRMSIIYRKDVYGKLRSGKIYDGSGKILYRVVYGYHKKTGRLVAEDMFNVLVPETRVITGPDGKPSEIEVPVRRLYHRYDAQGRPAKPIVFCSPKGKKAEELFGPEGSTYIKDPWSKKGKTANPNARRTR